MSQCRVVLDNYNGQYFPGTQIQGRVLVTLDSQTTIRGQWMTHRHHHISMIAIKVRIICHEQTSWMGEETYYDHSEKKQKTRFVQFKGNNDVLNNQILVYGQSSGTRSLAMGQHIYPFVLQLPSNLPSSYQCEKGSIIYKVTATVDRPMAFHYDDQFIITVNSPLDLNTLQTPDLLVCIPNLHPIQMKKTICCWCCAQGPISMDVELPKKTIVPNETVHIKARVQNMSNTNVESVSLKLQQGISDEQHYRHSYDATLCFVSMLSALYFQELPCLAGLTQFLTFKTDRPNRDSKTVDHVLVDIKKSGVGAHGENTYDFKVTLPPNISLPNFSQCTLFDVEYLYKIIAHLPGLTRNLEIKMYPEVGHIQIGYNNVGPSISSPSNIPYGQPPPYGEKQMYSPEPMQTPSANMGWSVNPSAPPQNQSPPAYDSLMSR